MAFLFFFLTFLAQIKDMIYNFGFSPTPSSTQDPAEDLFKK